MDHKACSSPDEQVFLSAKELGVACNFECWNPRRHLWITLQVEGTVLRSPMYLFVASEPPFIDDSLVWAAPLHSLPAFGQCPWEAAVRPTPYLVLGSSMLFAPSEHDSLRPSGIFGPMPIGHPPFMRPFSGLSSSTACLSGNKVLLLQATVNCTFASDSSALGGFSNTSQWRRGIMTAPHHLDSNQLGRDRSKGWKDPNFNVMNAVTGQIVANERCSALIFFDHLWRYAVLSTLAQVLGQKPSYKPWGSSRHTVWVDEDEEQTQDVPKWRFRKKQSTIMRYNDRSITIETALARTTKRERQ